MHEAIVVGAGPGGLAAALALRRAGIEPVVLERRPELAEAGSGLTLWPNALRALERLGLAGAVRAVSAPAHGIQIRSAGGRVLDATGPELMRRHFESGGAALLRADLQRVLADALGHERIRLATAVRSLAADGHGAQVELGDGRSERAGLVVGADGIRSAVRRALFGEVPLRYAGYVVWRAIARFALDEPIGTLTMGRGAQFGLFPMAGGRVYWFASLNVREGRIEGCRELGREGLLRAFGGWHAPIGDVIAATDPDGLVVTPIHDTAPFRQRACGVAVLVGDAAHPSTPALGQGACQAIEDAVVLGRALQEQPASRASALRAYEQARVERTNAMTRQARQVGSMGQWENRAACWVRDRMIEHTPERLRIHQLRRMFAFDPDAVVA